MDCPQMKELLRAKAQLEALMQDPKGLNKKETAEAKAELEKISHMIADCEAGKSPGTGREIRSVFRYVDTISTE